MVACWDSRPLGLHNYIYDTGVSEKTPKKNIGVSQVFLWQHKQYMHWDPHFFLFDLLIWADNIQQAVSYIY